MRSNNVIKTALMLICLLFFLGLVYSQDQAGNVWLLNEYDVVLPGQTFVTSVHVNTGSQKLMTYGFDLSYQSSLLQVESVSAGPDGFLSAGVVGTAGTLPLIGFDIAGKGPGPNLNIAVVHWKALAAGVSPLNLVVDNLTDSENRTIGNPPAGISSRVTVAEPDLVYGDMDGNGDVNIIDALMVAQYYVGLIQTLVPPLQGDVNADSRIDIVDALVIAQYYVGLIDELPVARGLTHKKAELVPVYPAGVPPLNMYPVGNPVQVVLRDAAGNPIPEKMVAFSGNVPAMGSSPVQTNTDGLAEVSVLVPYDAGYDYDTVITAVFAGDGSYAAATGRVLAHVYSPGFPTPPPTGTPISSSRTPTATPGLPHNYYYVKDPGRDDYVIVIDGSLGSYANPSGSVMRNSTVPGYTGNNYMESVTLPATIISYVYLYQNGFYGIGVRVYDPAVPGWVFKTITGPVGINFTGYMYRITFAFANVGTLIDRIILYPLDTPEESWQDLAREDSSVYVAGNYGSISVTIP